MAKRSMTAFLIAYPTLLPWHKTSRNQLRAYFGRHDCHSRAATIGEKARTALLIIVAEVESVIRTDISEAPYLFKDLCILSSRRRSMLFKIVWSTIKQYRRSR